MEEFKGMSRDTLRTKQPDGTWEFARNILLSKGFKSITNEDGFEYGGDTIPGDIIGRIVTAEHIVYFSCVNFFNGTTYTEKSYIGYTSLEENFTTYHPVLQSIYLGFKRNRPIEGVHIYNYKGELVVIFCDGVFADSNTPKLINLFNIAIPLTVDYELVNPSDLSKLQYYAQSLEGMIAIDYQVSGTLEADIVYITYCYVLPDRTSTTEFFPIHTLAYPTINYQNLDRRNIILALTELDSNYTQLKIGLVVNVGGGLIGYQSDIINYSGTTYNTIISSLANYIETAVDGLIIPSSVYSRIKTMTMHNSELVIGNLVKDSNSLKFQKFANLLQVRLWYDVREQNKYTLPTLCPDEVIALYIELHMLDGTYSEGFHLPNHTNPSNTDLNNYTNTEFNILGLNGVNNNINYKQFHLKNSGGFIDTTTIPCDITDVNQMELRWGFWKNEETYPNNDEYDSTLDYDGNALSSLDLRNTGILYHRVPGLDALVEKFPCILGLYDTSLYSSPTLVSGLVPAFSLNIDNFNTIVPQYILDQIQGFRLSVVKRKRGDTLVEDIHFAKQSWTVNQQTLNGDKPFEVTAMTKMLINGADDIKYNVAQFGTSNINTSNLHILKPNLSSKIVKANYGINCEYLTRTSPTVIPFKDFDFTNPSNLGNLGASGTKTYIKIKETQKYGKFIDVEYIPGNNTGFNTLFVDEFIKLKVNNTLQPANTVGTSILPNRWNPLLITGLDSTTLGEAMTNVLTYNRLSSQYINENYSQNECFKFHICNTILNLTKNVYIGFTPKEFITIGRTTLNNTQFKFREGGDVFTNNTFNGYVTIATGTNILGRLIYKHKAIRGMFSIFALSEIYKVYDRDTYVDYEISGGSNRVADLLTYDYDLKIFNKEQLRSLNDLISDIAFNINTPFVSYFPYRIHRSLKIGNETLTTNNLRKFLANRYKEMLNDRGEVIAVRGTNRSVFIQQRYSLFLVSIKDKLDSSATTTYVGESDIFDRLPEEILYAGNEGYIGSSSQFACSIFRDGYVVVDQVKGKIFIISTGVDEISKVGMVNWFNEHWKTKGIPYGFFTLNRFGRKQDIDNPFTQFGHTVGFDYKYNRLLFTKKEFNFLNPNIEFITYSFDNEWYYSIFNNGVDEVIITRLNYYDTIFFEETSKTLSYSLDNKVWVCEHDYFPNTYMSNSKGLYSVYHKSNEDFNRIWKHNGLQNKKFYFTEIESYVDLAFNSRFDLKKLYQQVSWITQVQIQDYNDFINIKNDFFKTIDAIQLYTDFQCTNKIELNTGFISRNRNTENEWNFNDFRDLVINSSLPIVNNEGEINNNNLNINKSWFEKSNFINTFIIVRMYMYSEYGKTVNIHCVNVKSRTSDR